MSDPNVAGGLPVDRIIELQRQYRFQWEAAQDCYVLLYPEGLIQLRGSAGEIMKHVDGLSSIDDIVANLEKAYPGQDLRPDVIGFLEHAHGKGWIRVKS
ncbi:MAG: pyrroloquinoline quinone biosynthesis peptide chaperone PqqD [Betaproteobacteria bacterium]|nr:pyrroloquinoline quinone biosynthesis peptide chaperone PqqD [Betaproteobacteria bacterium]